MTAELHWFPAYVSDWLGSAAISMMLPEQEGAYWRLLNLAWGKGDAEPSLPDDDAALAQMSRLGARWRRLGALVRDQFSVRDGRLYNEKLSAVWLEQQQKHDKAVIRASAGGKAKADKRRATSSAPSSATSTQQAVLTGCLEGAELELDRELETDLETLSVSPPAGEADVHAMLESDTDRAALVAIVVNARSRQSCVAAIRSMLTGNDPAVPTPDRALFGQALRDFAANGDQWNAALFRGYLNRAKPRDDAPLRVRRDGLERAKVILAIAKQYDLLTWNGNQSEYQRRQSAAASDPRAGDAFLQEIAPLRLHSGVGDQKSDHFAALEIVSRMAPPTNGNRQQNGKHR